MKLKDVFGKEFRVIEVFKLLFEFLFWKIFKYIIDFFEVSYVIILFIYCNVNLI